MKTAVVMCLALGLAAPAAAWESTSYRTPSGDLIREGMKKPEVLARLGKPIAKEKVRQEGVHSRKAAKAEAWSYRFPNETAVITFLDDRVTTIETIRR